MPKTLLLADDSVTIQKVVGISFASEDIEITTVDNGDAALVKARELRPDVILADVVMPGLSGYEVCEAIKAEPGLRHIPVLLLTGTFEAFDEARAAAAGAAGHVAKPFEAQTLVDRVHEILASAPAPEPERSTPEVATSTPTEEAAEPGATTDAFDFFSDSDPAPRTPDADALDDGALDLDEPDAAFAFGDEELADSLADASPGGPLDAHADAWTPPDATAAIASDTGSGAASRDPVDFAFDAPDSQEPEAPMSPDDLAHTALLDPAAGADLDVSSSDLAVDLSSGPGAATPVAEAPASLDSPPPVPAPYGDEHFAAAEPIDEAEATDPEALDPRPTVAPLSRDPVMDALCPPPVPTDTSLQRPLGVGSEPADAGMHAEASIPMPPPTAEPEAMAIDPFGAEPLEAEPMDDDGIEDDFAIGEAIDPSAVEPLPMSASAAEPPPAADADTLSPAMREELRDTLEKIAWDAFGQVTEKVVREAIERIERAAWEVVPKLAETLIQEEIRRLKGGNGSE